MKAKMNKGLKVPESGEYQCQRCNRRFIITGKSEEQLICPQCKDSNPQDLVPIYMENDPEEEQLYSKDDWQAGD